MTTIRSRSLSIGSSIAICTPLSISVPPLPRRPAVKPRALPMFSSLTGTGFSNSLLAWLANVMTWIVSLLAAELEHALHRLDHLVRRLARHRPADIDQEHDLARRALGQPLVFLAAESSA